jgi:oxalate decarboxylase
VSRGTPTLPKSDEDYRFRLTRAKPTVTTPGGTVTEADENSFPVVKGNAAAVFYLVLDRGALREPHWHPNSWEMDFCQDGRGEVRIVTPGGEESITTLEPGGIAFIPQGGRTTSETSGRAR